MLQNGRNLCTYSSIYTLAEWGENMTMRKVVDTCYRMAEISVLSIYTLAEWGENMTMRRMVDTCYRMAEISVLSIYTLAEWGENMTMRRVVDTSYKIRISMFHPKRSLINELTPLNTYSSPWTTYPTANMDDYTNVLHLGHKTRCKSNILGAYIMYHVQLNIHTCQLANEVFKSSTRMSYNCLYTCPLINQNAIYTFYVSCVPNICCTCMFPSPPCIHPLAWRKYHTKSANVIKGIHEGMFEIMSRGKSDIRLNQWEVLNGVDKSTTKTQDLPAVTHLSMPWIIYMWTSQNENCKKICYIFSLKTLHKCRLLFTNTLSQTSLKPDYLHVKVLFKYAVV